MCADVLVRASVHAFTRPCHLSTPDNPHPGQAQTAVFQNTAEGNYKLGQPLDHEAGRHSPAHPITSTFPSQNRLRPREQWLRPPHWDPKCKQASCTKPVGADCCPWWMAYRELALEVTGWDGNWGKFWWGIHSRDYDTVMWFYIKLQINQEFPVKLWLVVLISELLVCGNKCLSSSKDIFYARCGRLGFPNR